MIPVPNQKLAMTAWSRMMQQDCHPCGVLAYSGDGYSDIHLFMRDGGMITADGIFRSQAGDHYAFITTALPTDDWCDYAEARQLFWWQWFGQSFERWRRSRTPRPAQPVTPHVVEIIDVTAQAAAQTDAPGGATASSGVTVATQVTTQPSVQALIEIPTPPDTIDMDDLENELMAYPNDHSGLTRRGLPIPRGRYQPVPSWSWYYEGPYDIARVFHIDMGDVPCLKMCDSTHDLSRDQFTLDGVRAHQMEPFLKQLASDAKFIHIVRAFHP